jgi:hypothetical protein
MGDQDKATWRKSSVLLTILRQTCLTQKPPRVITDAMYADNTNEASPR